MKEYILFAIVAFLFFLGYDIKQNLNEEVERNILKTQEAEFTETTEKLSVNEKTKKEVKEIFTEFNILEDKLFFEKYLPILMFHYIEDVPSDSSDQMRYNLSFSPQKLEQFLIFFEEHNIKTLTFWDLKKIIERKKEFPEKAVMLTFDDGYKNHYDNAFPILKKYNAKGVFFIISSKPDNDSNYANWNQLKEMADNGQEIASHTVSHLNLVNFSKAEIKSELEISKNTIEKKIGKPVISLCYPAGKYNERVIEVAKENYLFARTTKLGKHFSFQKRYEIPIIRIFPTTGIASLKIWFDKN